MLELHGTGLTAHDGEGVTLGNAALERDTEMITAIARRLRVDELAFLTIPDHAARSAYRRD